MRIFSCFENNFGQMQKVLLRILVAAFFYLPLCLQAQTKNIQGEILDKQSERECYPKLKRKFTYTLRKNGKIEIKELPAQEIIQKIIFRQRDFEDGPGPQDEEKRNL